MTLGGTEFTRSLKSVLRVRQITGVYSKKIMYLTGYRTGLSNTKYFKSHILKFIFMTSPQYSNVHMHNERKIT